MGKMSAEQLQDFTQGRLMGIEALLNVAFREWGRPPEKVMAYLDQTKERLVATCLQSNMSDAGIAGMNQALDVGITALRGRIDWPDM